MQNPALLYPIFALAAWTGLVLMLIPVTRIRAARKREVVAKDFRYGESASVPGHVSIPNRNYMNLLELPVLFYVVCLLLFVTNNHSALAVQLAWAFVALRVLHSLIHLSYNNVIHRLTAFALSNTVLVIMWVNAAVYVSSTLKN